MNYHNIKHCDMVNGKGLRVTLFVSGCSNNCFNCQNPQTHDPLSGIPFDDNAREEIFADLNSSWCSGLTLSGGDPLYPSNRTTVFDLVKEIKNRFPNKTIWLYTGYAYEDIRDDLDIKPILECIDVIVDGKFIQSKHSYGLEWRGSSNQRVIEICSGKLLA